MGQFYASVDKAGPTGFALYRTLVKAGAACLVVRPKRLERHQRRRKNDPQDSRILAEELAAHHFGRTGLLVPVRVPTVQEESTGCRCASARRSAGPAIRSSTPPRAGRSPSVTRYRSNGGGPRVWPKLKDGFPSELARLLDRTVATAAAMQAQIVATETELKATAPEAPVGVGQLTAAVFEREVCAWDRFKSGKKLSSFYGLCPSEDSSADRHRLGAIDKHGSARMRFWCQEAAWRLCKHQPDHHVILWARQKRPAPTPAG